MQTQGEHAILHYYISFSWCFYPKRLTICAFNQYPTERPRPKQDSTWNIPFERLTTTPPCRPGKTHIKGLTSSSLFFMIRTWGWSALKAQPKWTNSKCVHNPCGLPQCLMVKYLILLIPPLPMPVGKQEWIEYRVDLCLENRHHVFFKAFHHNRSQSLGSIIIIFSRTKFLWSWNNDGFFPEGGHSVWIQKQLDNMGHMQEEALLYGS